MSGICDIFPEDPSCAIEEPVAEPVVDEPTVEEEVVVGGVEEEEGVGEGEGEEGDAEPEMKADFSETAMKAVSDWNAVKDMSSFADLSPMMGSLGWAGAAATWASYCAMHAFRYRSASTFYDFGKIGDDTNYYKLSD